MFSAGDLDFMRDIQTDHMMDTCIIQTYSSSQNSYGEEVITYTDGSAISCGLDMRPGNERHSAEYTASEYDATVRLPITTVPDMRDRIKITKRFDETLSTALVFEITGPIQRGPSGVRMQLKKVTT
jgi:hypothetical protein